MWCVKYPQNCIWYGSLVVKRTKPRQKCGKDHQNWRKKIKKNVTLVCLNGIEVSIQINKDLVRRWSFLLSEFNYDIFIFDTESKVYTVHFSDIFGYHHRLTFCIMSTYWYRTWLDSCKQFIKFIYGQRVK